MDYNGCLEWNIGILPAHYTIYTSMGELETTSKQLTLLARPCTWRCLLDGDDEAVSGRGDQEQGGQQEAGGHGGDRGPLALARRGHGLYTSHPSLCKHRPHLGGLHLELEMFIPLGSIFIPPSAILSSRSRRYQLYVCSNCRHTFGRERNYVTINNHNNQFSFIIQRKYCTLQSLHHRDLPLLSKAG